MPWAHWGKAKTQNELVQERCFLMKVKQTRNFLSREKRNREKDSKKMEKGKEELWEDCVYVREALSNTIIL